MIGHLVQFFIEDSNQSDASYERPSVYHSNLMNYQTRVK